MRTTLHSRLRNDEDGVTATMLVIAMVALLGVAVLAVDGGLLWLSQRGQVADTDSAALAAARQLIDNPCSTQSVVDGVATELVDANDGETALFDREPTLAGDNVTIRRPASATCADSNVTVGVSTQRDAVSIFAGVLGFGVQDTGVVSYAQVVAPINISGVVPIAFCEDDPHVVEWRQFVLDIRNGDVSGDPRADAIADYNLIDDPHPLPPYPDPLAVDHPTALYPGAQTPVHRMPFDKNFDGGDDCGADSPGNWGWIDFNDGAVGTGPCVTGDSLCDWIRNGYEPGVVLPNPGDPSTFDCDASDAESPADDCPAGIGFRRRLQEVLLDRWQCPASTPTDECETLFVVLYSGDNGEPAANSEYLFSGVMGVVVRDVVGNNANDSYMDLELVDVRYSGPGTAVPTDYTGPLGVVLCGTHDFDNCNQ